MKYGQLTDGTSWLRRRTVTSPSCFLSALAVGSQLPFRELLHAEAGVGGWGAQVELMSLARTQQGPEICRL